MTLLEPVWLILAGLALIIAVLHMRRRRQFDVPSVLLWRLLDNPGTQRRTLRWPPPSLLLFLQLAIVLLVALALTQPLFGANRGDNEHSIFLIDASASMRATDISPNRFDAAMTALTSRLEAINAGSGNRFSVISVSANPRIEIARQTDSDGILPLLDVLAATDAEADWATAASLASTLVGDDETPTIVLLTDGSDTGDAAVFDAFPDYTVERAVFGRERTGNLALTAQLAPDEEEEGIWNLTGTVTFAGEDPELDTIVEVLFQPFGQTAFVAIDEIEVELPTTFDGEIREPRQPVAFDLEIDPPGAGVVMASLSRDSGPADNQMRFVVYAAPSQLRVLYLGAQSTPLIAALQSFDFIDLVASDQLPGTGSDFDLIIVNNAILPFSPDTNVLWIGAARVGGSAPPTLVEAPSISGWNADHPLAREIIWPSVGPATGYRFPRAPGATVLLESGGVPLVQARTTPDGRDVRLAFDIDDAAWADQAGLPVFISNLVEWLGVAPGTMAPRPCVAGRVCTLEARLLDGVVLDERDREVWSAGSTGQAYLLDGIERTFVPERAGLYRLVSDDGARLIAVNAVSTGETEIAATEPAESTTLNAGAGRLWWWLLAIAFVLLLAETWFAGRGPEQFLKRTGLSRTNPLSTRRRMMLAARIGAVVFLFAAVIGLPWIGREPAEDVVVVMGGELGPGAGNTDRNRILQEVAENLGDGGARGGLIATGETTRIAADLGGDVGLGAATDAVPGTNLEEALLIAAAMVPSDRLGRVVLATDGNETEGDIARAVALLAERGLAVDIQPLTELPQGEVLVEAVTAPPRVYDGDIFPIEAVLFSQREGTASVTISRAGEVILEQDVTLLAGRNVVETVMPAGEEGGLLVEVTIEAEGDTFSENNVNGLIVDVRPSPSIVVVTPQPPLGEYFAQALTIQGLEADILRPAEAPTTLEGWLEYDTIVMMNVPAIVFDTENQEFIEEAVRVHGRGLLLLGGENTFGPGGYYQTPFEEMSPLSARIEHDAPEVAIVFVLDRSSSMGQPIGDVTRLDIAKEATVTAISLLNQQARVGVVVFDSQSYLLLPITTERDDQLVREALLPLIEEQGGTNMYPGLATAIEELMTVDSATKHIVVMTDGITGEGNFEGIAQAASQAGISISAVGIGAGLEDPLLNRLADLTGGTYHSTGDFRALPAILSQEALLLANSPFQEQIAPVAWLDRDADFLAGLPDEFPPIYAFVRTTAKPLADVHLVATDNEGAQVPLMATWRYGNGHVLALATHGAGAGTAEWIQMPEYPLLWSQTIRQFLPDAPPPGLSVALERAGDVVEVTANVLNPDGTPMEDQLVTATVGDDALVLERVGPGRYQADYAATTGAYQVDVAVGDMTASSTIYVAYPARFNFGRTNFDKIQALAASTGGEILLGDEPIFSDERQWVAVPGWRVWTVIALALFMLDLTIRHAPSLFGLRTMARRARPGLAVPAQA